MKVIEQLGGIIIEPKSIDLLLLTFNKETNLQEALDLIAIELQSCLYIQRFDFFHKLMILSSWQSVYSPPASKPDLLTLFTSHYYKLQTPLSPDQTLFNLLFHLYAQNESEMLSFHLKSLSSNFVIHLRQLSNLSP